MNGPLIFILKLIIGKNTPALVRRIVTWIGAALVALAATHAAGPLDPSLGAASSLGDISAENLTLGQVVQVVTGLLMIYASRLMSFLRARRLDLVASWVGPLIGRSIPQLLGAGLTAVSGWLAVLGINSEDPASLPVATIIGAIVSWALAAALSAWEDERRNPHTSSPAHGLAAFAAVPSREDLKMAKEAEAKAKARRELAELAAKSERLKSFLGD